MSTRCWFSCNCCHRILSLVCIVLSLSLISGCIAVNPLPTPSPKPESAPAAESPGLISGPEPELKPAPALKVEPELKPEPKPEPRIELKPEPPLKVKPELKPEPVIKPEPPPKVEPEPKPEPEPEIKIEPKPAPKPALNPIPRAIIYQNFGLNLRKAYLRWGKRDASISIYKILGTGERVTGFTEINAEIETLNRDRNSYWYVEVLGPDAKKISFWRENYTSTNNHNFSFTAPASGNYTVRVGHYSDFEKILFLKIWPQGWQIARFDGKEVEDFE